MSKVARRAAQARDADDSAYESVYATACETAGATSTAAVAPRAVLPRATTGTCARCTHRDDDRRALERGIAGLVTFSSGFGASVADSRLCRLHDQLVSPGDTCTRFSARS